MIQRTDSEGNNLAWKLYARKHPKRVYETDDHGDPANIQRAMVRLEPELRAEYPMSVFGPIKRSIIPNGIRWAKSCYQSGRVGELDFPRQRRSGIAGLEEIRRFRVYADIHDDSDLADRMRNSCRQLMA